MSALPATGKAMRKAICGTNDHKREIFGAACKLLRDCICRWHSDVYPNQKNNNFSFP